MKMTAKLTNPMFRARVHTGCGPAHKRTFLISEDLESLRVGVRALDIYNDLVAALLPLAAIAEVLPVGEDWPDDRTVFGFNLVNITAGQIRQTARIVARAEGE